MSRRARTVTIVLAVMIASAGGTAYWWTTRPDAVPLAADTGRPDMAMASGAPTPAADPPRGDVAIDIRRQQLIGVRIAPVMRMLVSSPVIATGVVRYDETRRTDVNVRLDGWIRDLYVDFIGQPVRLGDRLFTLYSPELVATQNEFLLALRNRDQALVSVLTDSRDYADRLVDAARQRLALWDLSADQIRSIQETRQPIEAITIAAPASGFVLEKQAVRGMRVMAGQTLYTIADVSTVWVEADVYEQDISLVRIGQTARVTLDAYPGQAFTSRATYLYPSVDPQTRTMKVRFQFANQGGRLKPGMFANVELSGVERQGLTVPADAVLDSGRQQTVFVAEGEGVFTPRTVKAGRRLGDTIEVTEGLREGEQVATSATFFLDSESQLRAGLQNFEATPAAPAASASPSGPALDIQFRPLVDPPRTGDNTFEVRVTRPGGRAVTDAEVSVQLFMPAMPTMNMPAMRNETRLPHAGGGVYRGSGQVMTGGRWEVTVTVTRGGQRAGSKQFGLVAR